MSPTNNLGRSVDLSGQVCIVCQAVQSGDVESAIVPCNVRAFADESFRVWRCQACGSLHCLEQIDFAHYYANYLIHRPRYGRVPKMLFRNRLHWLLQNGLKRCDAILDYGCGSGLFVRYLKENGYQAIGFDPFVERFNDPGILQRKFDVVVLQDVIEHVPDPAALLATCVQALSDDGFIGIGTPNADEIALVAKPHWPMELHQPYHRHMFSEAGLAGLCERAGLAKGKIYRRSYTDTLVPGINMAFGKMYIDDNGGYIDALYKLPRLKLPTPKYWFVAFFGYFLRSGGTMFCVFRKRAGQAIQSGAQNADQSA